MNKTPKNTIIELHSENCMRSYYFKSWRAALKAIDLCYPGIEQDRTGYNNGHSLQIIVQYKDWTGLTQKFDLHERQFSTRLE